MYDKDKIFRNYYKYDDMKRAEHMAVRNAVGWYYYTHQLLEVTGTDAAAFLDWIFMNPVANLKNGSGRYTQMLNDDGVIIDDVVVTRQDENRFWISTLFADNVLLPWLNARKTGKAGDAPRADSGAMDDIRSGNFSAKAATGEKTSEGSRDVAFRPLTREYEMVSVQGPRALELMDAIAETAVDELKLFNMRDNRIAGFEVKVAKGGFSGERIGFEIYFAPENRDALFSVLRAEAEKLGGRQVTDTQIMIWTLPTEKGFYLMTDMRGTNPFEVGFDRIKWERDFIGKEALLKIQETGPKRRLLGFTVEDERAHIMSRQLSGPGQAVILNGDEIGRVTKFTYSYVLEKQIGYALIETDKAVIGQKVLINDYEAELCDKVFC